MPAETVCVQVQGLGNAQVPLGIELGDAISLASPGYDGLPIVEARVNGLLCGLRSPVMADSLVELVTVGSRTGHDVYRRTVSFILGYVMHKLHPGRHFALTHSFNRLVRYHSNGEDFSEEQISAIQDEMRNVIEQDLPIVPAEMSFSDAIAWFKSNNKPMSTKLIETQNTAFVKVHRLGDFISLAIRPLCPNTGMASLFKLQISGTIIDITLASHENPIEMTPYEIPSHIVEHFEYHRKAVSPLELSCVGEVNQPYDCSEQPLNPHIPPARLLRNEMFHNQRIAELTNLITPEIKLVLICGPSSSGKTTFARRVGEYLRVHPHHPRVPLNIGMDMYYGDIDKCPRDSDGKPDWEDPDALDHEQLSNDLASLVRGEQVIPPMFDFKVGKPIPHSGTPLKLSEMGNGILIMEGIHALNPKFSELIPPEQKFRIFIAPHTQLNIDELTPFRTTETRLLRRMVRDARTRGYSAEMTLSRWEGVRKGETRFIFPCSETADFIFNSALEYEPAVMAHFARRCLRNVSPSCHDYWRARQLLDVLGLFCSLDEKWVPSDSLLREFIGNLAFGEAH